jgi:prolyl oligopeptidase
MRANKRIVTVDVNNQNQKTGKFHCRTENVLSPSTGGYFFANYMKDAVSLVKQYDYSENWYVKSNCQA